MHGLQLVWPSSSWYVPAGHLVQTSCFEALLNVPAAHGVSASLPTGQNVPSLQTVQLSALTIAMPTFFVVPPGHGSAAAAPSAQ